MDTMQQAGLPRTLQQHYSTVTLDPIVHSVPEHIQRGMKEDPNQYVYALVEHLRSIDEGGNDHLLQLKALHDWVCDNIAYNVIGYETKEYGATDWVGVCKNGNSVCQGYATLFQHLCDVAGFDCKTVSGYSRGASFDLHAAHSTELAKTNHAWNAVKVNGSWHLLDCTWNAGHVNGSEYIKSYNTSYLFLEPQAMLYTHLPEDPKWQLLPHPIDPEEWVQLPYLRGRFFLCGCVCPQDVLRVNACDEGQFTMTIPTDPHSQMIFDIKELKDHPHNKYGLPFVLTETLPNGRALQICCRVPAMPFATLHMYVRNAHYMDTDEYHTAGEVGLSPTGSIPYEDCLQLAFPKQYSTFAKPGILLFSPMTGLLERGCAVRFAINVPDVIAVAVVTKEPKKWHHLTKLASSEQMKYERGTVTVCVADVWAAEVPIDDDVVPGSKITVYAKYAEGTSYDGILQYIVC
eukprot:m.88421 g.88421  ORF g.88421 m.88421 type:complete len:460 (-) comp12860_c0_seq2:2214-3593(-)